MVFLCKEGALELEGTVMEMPSYSSTSEAMDAFSDRLRMLGGTISRYCTQFIADVDALEEAGQVLVETDEALATQLED